MKTSIIHNFNDIQGLRVPARPLRAVVYARVSTEEQVRQELSIPLMQIPECVKMIQQNGWRFVKSYTDAGKPCNSFINRPELQVMLKEVERYDVVVVWSFDRLFGDSESTRAKIFETLDKAKKQITSARQQVPILGLEEYDPKSLNATTYRSFSSIQVSYDRQIRRERLMRAKTETIQCGKQIFAPCYGYKIVRKVHPTNDKRTIGYRFIEEEEAKILKRIFSERVEGRSLRQICVALNNDKIRTRNNKDWVAVRIARVLSNPFPCGFIAYNMSEDRRFGDDRVRTAFERKKWKYVSINPQREKYYKPIITKELFDKVQEINRIRNNHKGRSCYSRNVLAGLLKCPVCGSPMVACHYKKYKNPPFLRFTYVCSQWNSKKKCVNKCYTAHHIQAKVIKEIEKFINHPRIFEKYYLANKVEKTQEIKSELLSLNKRLEKLQLRINNLNLKYIDKKIQENYYQKLLEGFEEEERSLQERIEQLHSHLDEIKERQERIIHIKALGDEITTRFKELDIIKQKQILHTLIESIELGNDKKTPKIVFRV